MLQIRMTQTWLAAHLAGRREHDRGSDIVQSVIIVGLFAAAAIIIVGILVAKAHDAADAVRTQ